jgi:hypothetical protein
MQTHAVRVATTVKFPTLIERNHAARVCLCIFYLPEIQALGRMFRGLSLPIQARETHAVRVFNLDLPKWTTGSSMRSGFETLSLLCSLENPCGQGWSMN